MYRVDEVIIFTSNKIGRNECFSDMILQGIQVIDVEFSLRLDGVSDQADCR